MAKRLRRGAIRRLRALAVRAREAAPPKPPRPLDTTAELSVLFVCLGNICRSPIAEGILRTKLAERGLLGRIAVDSAGTSGRTVGRPPDDRARLVASRHRVAIGDLRARQFVTEDFERFDRIVVFDEENRRAVFALAPDAEARSRVMMLRGEEGEVADPVEGSMRDFEETFRIIEEGCDALLKDSQARLRS
jgi:protein-tyrosine phosphatase